MSEFVVIWLFTFVFAIAGAGWGWLAFRAWEHKFRFLAVIYSIGTVLMFWLMFSIWRDT